MFVMAALEAAIQLLRSRLQLDGRVKPGHDESLVSNTYSL